MLILIISIKYIIHIIKTYKNLKYENLILFHKTKILFLIYFKQR